MNTKDNRRQWTLLHLAAEKGHTETVKALKDGNMSIHMAAGKGRTSTVKTLIAKGAKVNTRDKDGITPLHVAAGTFRTSNRSRKNSNGRWG